MALQFVTLPQMYTRARGVFRPQVSGPFQPSRMLKTLHGSALNKIAFKVPSEEDSEANKGKFTVHFFSL